MRVVFAGTPAVALPSLDALLASDHEVVAVITRPDAPAGRGRRTTSSPVADRARDHGLATLTPQTPRDPEFQGALAEIQPDCVPVVAFGALIPPVLLDLPEHGWVNLHFSLLPAWRGAAPVQHAVLYGDEITGASTFRLEAGLDTGPVFGVVTERIRADDTSGALLERLALSGSRLLVATLDGLASGECVGVPQPSDGISLAPKLSVDDVRIDWSAPANRVDRLVRAATPSPGAWTTFRERRLKVGPVRLDPASPPLAPGEVAEGRGVDGDRADGDSAGVRVGTGDGVVRLGHVQPEGKAMMDAEAWARGVRLEPADRCR